MKRKDDTWDTGNTGVWIVILGMLLLACLAANVLWGYYPIDIK